MDAAVGWVLDVSLSVQQTCSTYIFLDNVHSRCSRVGPRCQPSEQQKPMLYMLIIFMDAAVGWVLDVRLSEQETCALFILFMDAAVGCLLDVSLSKQQTCAIYIFSDNVHSHCSRVGP
jgi:hypothetical protein